MGHQPLLWGCLGVTTEPPTPCLGWWGGVLPVPPSSPMLHPRVADLVPGLQSERSQRPAGLACGAPCSTAGRSLNLPASLFVFSQARKVPSGPAAKGSGEF
jgi:hypothetical protein